MIPKRLFVAIIVIVTSLWLFLTSTQHHLLQENSFKELITCTQFTDGYECLTLHKKALKRLNITGNISFWQKYVLPQHKRILMYSLTLHYILTSIVVLTASQRAMKFKFSSTPNSVITKHI